MVLLCVFFFFPDQVLEMDADHDCIFTMLQFPDRDYEGYSVNRTTDGWYFLISHKDVQYRMTIAYLMLHIFSVPVIQIHTTTINEIK